MIAGVALFSLVFLHRLPHSVRKPPLVIASEVSSQRPQPTHFRVVSLISVRLDGRFVACSQDE